MSMNMLSFVWFILFYSSPTLSQSDDSEEFTSSLAPEDVTCPCFEGYISDILSTCSDAAERDEDIRCIGAADFDFPDINFFALTCIDETILEESQFGPFEYLRSPLFASSRGGSFLPFNVCIKSENGLLGLLRFLIKIILEFIDELLECFDGDRRRLTSHHHHGHDNHAAVHESPQHGTAQAFGYFVELLYTTGRDKLFERIVQKDGLFELAMKMKAQATTASGSRRLLDSDSEDGLDGIFGDDFDICEFEFLAEIFPNPLGEFDPEEFEFEAFLSDIFNKANCDDNPDSLVCFVLGVLLDDDSSGSSESSDGDRRRLESSDDDSGDDDDDDDGDVIIRFLPSEVQEVRCLETVTSAFTALIAQGGGQCRFIPF